MALTLRTQSHIVVVDSRPRDYDELASLAGEWAVAPPLPYHGPRGGDVPSTSSRRLVDDQCPAAGYVGICSL